MKFNPVMPSYLISPKQATEQENLDFIKQFYQGEVTCLELQVRGKPRGRIYQIGTLVDIHKMRTALSYIDEGYTKIQESGCVVDVQFADKHCYTDTKTKYVKGFIKMLDNYEYSIYCKSTDTYWRVV